MLFHNGTADRDKRLNVVAFAEPFNEERATDEPPFLKLYFSPKARYLVVLGCGVAVRVRFRDGSHSALKDRVGVLPYHGFARTVRVLGTGNFCFVPAAIVVVSFRCLAHWFFLHFVTFFYPLWTGTFLNGLIESVCELGVARDTTHVTDVTSQPKLRKVFKR
jgi:hypothetical protein